MVLYEILLFLLPFIIVGIFVWFFNWRQRNKHIKHRVWWEFIKAQKGGLAILQLVIVSLLIVNLGFGSRELDQPDAKVRYGKVAFNSLLQQLGFFSDPEDMAEAERLFQMAMEGYDELLQTDSLNLDLHFERLDFLKNDAYSLLGKSIDSIEAEYRRYSQSDDTATQQIGFFGLGMLELHAGSYEEALLMFDHVADQELKYLELLRGDIFRNWGENKPAKRHYLLEIENNGEKQLAYYSLFDLYRYQDMDKELNELLRQKSTWQYLPAYIAIGEFFERGNALGYLYMLYKLIFDNMGVVDFLAAFFIMMAWLLYIYNLDIFEKEKWYHVAVVLVLGMVFAVGALFIGDLTDHYLKFGLNGGFWNDFLYCFLGIGLSEELVKFLPVFILMITTRAFNEPYDYILYPSVAALGFAFTENLLYFGESPDDLTIIHWRASIAVVSHMFDASIIGYGLLLNRYRWNNRFPEVLVFIVFFLLAALAHGFYDFWLLSTSVSGFGMITFVFFIISISLWFIFKNNALNNSTSFTKKVKLDNSKLRNYLTLSLTGILMVEYFAMAWSFGPTIANESLLGPDIILSSLMILFLSTKLTDYDLVPGKWISVLDIFNRGKNYNYTGWEVTIGPHPSNLTIANYLPLEGELVQEHSLSTSWRQKGGFFYMVKLEVPHSVDSYDSGYVMVQPQYPEMIKRQKVLVQLFLVNDAETLNPQSPDITLMGYAIMDKK